MSTSKLAKMIKKAIALFIALLIAVTAVDLPLTVHASPEHDNHNASVDYTSSDYVNDEDYPYYDLSQLMESVTYTPQVETATVMHSGTAGTYFLPWRLYNDGTLAIDGGILNITANPWHNHRDDIFRVILTQPITAGVSLRNLFAGLTHVRIIEGLELLDTSATVDMSGMFRDMRSLTSLDLSSFDTSNVTRMDSMFRFAQSLEYLDVSRVCSH